MKPSVMVTLLFLEIIYLQKVGGGWIIADCKRILKLNFPIYFNKMVEVIQVLPVF